MAELYCASVRAVSAMLSRPGRWISPGRRYRALPPSSAKPFSKLTRVRVEAASKIIARCWPGRNGVSGRLLPQRLEVHRQPEQVLELLARVVEVGEEVAPAKRAERGEGGVHERVLLDGPRDGEDQVRIASGEFVCPDGQMYTSSSRARRDKPHERERLRQMDKRSARVSRGARDCPSLCCSKTRWRRCRRRPSASSPPPSGCWPAAASRRSRCRPSPREAGESKASIGYHFGNKDGLVTALVDSLAHDANRELIAETGGAAARRGAPPRAHRRRDAHRRRRRDRSSRSSSCCRTPARTRLRERVAALYDGYRDTVLRCLDAADEPDAARAPAAVRDAHDRHRRRSRHPARPRPRRRRRARRHRALGGARAAVLSPPGPAMSRSSGGSGRRLTRLEPAA